MSNSTRWCKVRDASPLVAGGDTGIFFPALGNTEVDMPDGLRVVLYLVALLWCFMGVAIIADIFMGAIEKITSKKRLVKRKRDDKMITVKVWNDTVSNLTLMALGSSAPEILLSVIELVKNKMFSGALGPSTIVGSAAFNLLIITAVCVVALPPGESRKVKDTSVFAITAFFSVFAYLWLLFILKVTTPDVVSVWEGALTFLFFPILVLLAYLADIGYFDKMLGSFSGAGRKLVLTPFSTPEEQAEMILSIKQKYGHGAMEHMKALMEYEFAPAASRAANRVNAARVMTGGKKVLKESVRVAGMNIATELIKQRDSQVDRSGEPRVGFDQACYAVSEDHGTVKVFVTRSGDRSKPVEVKYKTRPGTAEEKSDYEACAGTLHFKANEIIKDVTLNILHEKKHEPTEEFYLDLSDPSGCELQSESACIVVIDAEQAGTLSFAEPQLHVPESTEKHDVSIEVKRTGGAQGVVKCNYKTEQDTALPDKDYIHVAGVLEFKDKQVSATIKVEILPKGRYESTEHFRLILEEPQGGVQFNPLMDGGQDRQICTVFIDADPTTTAHMDSVMRHFQVNWDVLAVGHSNWKDQFVEAWYVNGSKEEQKASPWRDCILHGISMPWKLAFACVPPTDFAGGWVCFFSALLMIGLVTAIIGDLAGLLGCALSISDSATAITIVALGTSLPDTFASKTAAVQDPTADACIGNVTGSNSVNVFLGLGLPWFMGAIYWTVMDCKPGDAWYSMMAEERWPSSISVDHPDGAFVVVAGSLGISVATFCVCAVMCLGTLVLRRKYLGGELGGDKKWCWATAVFFTFLWLIYISVSIVYDAMQED
mmetsp:Transcript_81474/g.174509  ORF Transcript_81474/g.174509 Transcript_81474/m.174509 type:complete len:826 (+) Transcript_81474:121-2598(+)